MKAELVKYLEQFITPERAQLIERTINNRTRYLSIVLEDIYQPQNASAVLRTCECLGIQDLHIVENNNSYRVNPDVTLGSDQWLNIYKYNKPGSNNTETTLKSLKDNGYRVVATSLYGNTIELNSFDLNKGKAAFVFGTEVTGISDTVHKMADEFVKIPIYGFTESYNISVSVAIIFSNLVNKLHLSDDISWKLSDDEIVDIKLEWLRKTIKKPHLIEKYFFENIYKNQ